VFGSRAFDVVDAVRRGGEAAGLPQQDEALQAGEDAGEAGQDEGVQGVGQPAAICVRLGGGAQDGELGGQGVRVN